MLYFLSKCALVNLFKHPRNITSLRDTLVPFGLGLSSRRLRPNICTKTGKFVDIGLGLVLLRFRKINVISSLAVNWKLLWQTSCEGFYHAVYSPAWGTIHTETKPFHEAYVPCTLKKYNSYEESGCFWYWVWQIWEILLTFFRAVRLGLTFLPILMIYPLAQTNNSLSHIWYKLLLSGLEFSGPIFIKLGQWASTRRDLFSEELCSCLERLQRKNTPHSWYYTTKSFERVFGPNWQNLLLLDNEGKPVGAGCCAQVYKGWLDYDYVMAEEEACRQAGADHFNKFIEQEHENSYGVEVLEMFGIGSILSHFQTVKTITEEDDKRKLIPVAIKVLHPRMTTTLRRDLFIMKAAANLFTWLVPSLKWISLPECVDDFTILMQAQVDFCIEASNLDRFTANFAGMDTVRFPRPFWSLTTTFLLVETYEDGRAMEYYINNNETTEANVKIADIGVNALLKMVFDDNFAHGDLHPGNMLIQERKTDCCTESPVWWWSRLKKPQPEYQLVILDCGIVVSLDARGRKLLREVFKAVVNGEGELVADLFLANSKHQCPDPKVFKEDMRVLVLSALAQTSRLTGIEVSSLIAQLFTTMIHHRVKMDGCFSSVILAMMVVEGMGRSLDPLINMVQTAKPYLFKPMLKYQ